MCHRGIKCTISKLLDVCCNDVMQMCVFLFSVSFLFVVLFKIHISEKRLVYGVQDNMFFQFNFRSKSIPKCVCIE